MALCSSPQNGGSHYPECCIHILLWGCFIPELKASWMKSRMREGNDVNRIGPLIKLLIIPLPLSAGSVLENDSIVLMVQFICKAIGTNPGLCWDTAVPPRCSTVCTVLQLLGNSHDLSFSFQYSNISSRKGLYFNNFLSTPVHARWDIYFFHCRQIHLWTVIYYFSISEAVSLRNKCAELY